ncbi:MAG: D-alanine--D-alanine ligase A, partial [Clostridiaceae bacterium]|nr:D-alanine--D-alanine ligase A [Clostridiaceae bacterium]
MKDKKRVLIIFGGQSSEHEVSRVSATSIIKNINTDKFDISILGITKEGRWLPYNGPLEKIASGEWEEIALKGRVKSLEANCSIIDSIVNNGIAPCENNQVDNTKQNRLKTDVIFPVLHGANGEDGTIQGLFEIAGIPYVGPGVLGSALGMDKIYAKIIFEKAGIPQADYL